MSDLYKKLQESHARREIKRKSVQMTTQVTHKTNHPALDTGQLPSKSNPAQDRDRDRTQSVQHKPEQNPEQEQNPDQGHAQQAQQNHTQTKKHEPDKPVDIPRRQQMLKVLRESEARHKQKVQRDASIGIGDLVTVLSGPYADATAQVCDLDYINLVAMVERVGSGQRLWLNLSILAPTD